MTNAPPPASNPRARAWRGRFGLRTLLVVTTLSAVALAALVAPQRRYERTIARLNELGAVCYFEHQLRAVGPGGQPIGDAPPRDPWRERFLGQHHAWKLIEVQLYSGGPGRREAFTDDDAALLAAAPAIQSLLLHCPQLTDVGLRRLATLPGLTYLDARGSAITPAGAAEFRRARPNVELRFGDPAR